MYVKEFVIRWSELDANRHVANSSYVDLLSETRISYLHENGFTQEKFAEYNIGPVIFSEELYYIKEILPGEKIKISIELAANDINYKYIKFSHCIFNHQNKLSIYSETFFGWFSLDERKLVVPPNELQIVTAALGKSVNYRLMEENVSLKNPKIPFGKTI